MSTRSLRVLAAEFDDSVRELRMAVLTADKDVVRLEIDIEEAQAQNAFGMVAILRGELQRKMAYAQGLRKAQEIIDE